jgi:hypothetical protein
MTGRPLPVETGITSPPPLTPKGSVKGVVFIGFGIVLAVCVIALAFGLVRNLQVEKVTDRVIGKHTDGWTTQSEPDASQPGSSDVASTSGGHFSVELPGDRTRETVNFVGTNDGKLVVWTAKIGTEATLQAGWGVVTPPPPGTMPPSGDGSPPGTFADQSPTRQNYLQEKAHAWMSANRLSPSSVTEGATFMGGAPAYYVKGTTVNTTLNNKDAFTQMAMAISGDKLYVVIVTSIYKDAEQFDKMMSTFLITS